MKKVPYEPNRGNSCALSCYTMAARYLWPDEDITFEQLAKTADWRRGYAVWGFRVWKWMMDKGARIVDYDVIDYEAWAKEGIRGYKNSVSKEHFDWVYKHSYDLEAETQNIGLAFEHPNFTYVRKEIAWADVEREFKKPGICDLTLNIGLIDEGRDGIHRVVLVDITDTEVVFHDPNKAGDGAYRRVSKKLFKSMMESLRGAELCRYSLGDG